VHILSSVPEWVPQRLSFNDSCHAGGLKAVSLNPRITYSRAESQPLGTKMKVNGPKVAPKSAPVSKTSANASLFYCAAAVALISVFVYWFLT
jgi:hypothetical protein